MTLSSWLIDLWLHLLPVTDDVVVRSRIGLIVTTCLVFVLIMCFMIATWWLSGDLQRETVWFSVIFLLILSGISFLAYATYWVAASWLLIICLTLLMAADTYYFGVSSPSLAAYSVPILISAFTLGLTAALCLAFFIILVIWLCAFSELTEWYQPQLPKARSHRTFNAPLMTVIFFLIALLAGLWSDTFVAYLS